MTPKKILLCTDFSENSDRARSIALDYAEVFGSELLIAHVIDHFSGFPMDEAGLHSHIRDILDHMQTYADAKLEQLAKECAEVVKVVKTFSLVGVPHKELVSLAEDQSVELIVMGTHGWTGIRNILLGSVAEKVLKTAVCPLLVVRS